MTAGCGSCGKGLDPLRAGRVAAFAEGFVYFCDDDCRARFRGMDGLGLTDDAIRDVPPRRTSDPGASAKAFPSRDTAGASGSTSTSPRPASVRPASVAPGAKDGANGRRSEPGAARLAGAPSRRPGSSEAPGKKEDRLGRPGVGSSVSPLQTGRLAPLGPASGRRALAIGEREIGLTAAGTFLGAFGATLSLAGESVAISALRFVLIVGALGALVVRRARGLGDPLEMNPAALLLPSLSAIAIAIWAALVRDAARAEAAAFAGLVVASSCVAVHVVDRLRRAASADGETADLVALDGARIDVASRAAKSARRLAELGSFAAAAIVGIASFVSSDASSESTVPIALAACAGYLALGTAAVATMAALHVGRSVREATGRAINYRSALDWDRASEVGIAAFCVRGTLLLGEPELVDVHVVAATSEERVLSLLAGAEASAHHPVAAAVDRAVVARHIVPDAVRSPALQPGLGVTAVASSGEPLVVGSRALMLREKISIAMMEGQIAEVEGRGRTALLIALGGRLLGLVGLQDGLRPGARAAVQHLLDAHVEPVIVSGDSRERCEAIANALDIEHVRPEVLPIDQPLEVQRLAEGGVSVAVIGRAEVDDAALSAAQVSVALAVPESSSRAQWSISLPSDDVRDAAESISLARKTRQSVRLATILAAVPGMLASLALAFGVVPAAWVAVAAAVGAVLSGLHVRAADFASRG